MILLDKNLEEFFMEELRKTQQNSSLFIADDLEFYLATLLSKFVIHDKELDGFNTPLALIHKRALESTAAQRIEIYRQLGDYSLYVGGYFSESLEKKVVGLDYYVSMGSAAYESVSSLTKKSHIESLYRRLAEQFDILVFLLNQLAKEKPQSLGA